MVNPVVIMWGSLFIGDEYDVPLQVADEFSNTVLKSIAQHPHFQPQSVPFKSLNTVIKEDDAVSRFSKNGDGWFTAPMPTPLFACVAKCADTTKRFGKNMTESSKTYAASRPWRLI